MTKHTAGPWECSERPVGPFWHISSDNSVRGPCKSGRQAIASVHAANKRLDPEYAAMFSANARLIAAAPDLLAALQALEANGHLISFEGDTPEDIAISKAALAAIAKATGSAA